MLTFAASLVFSNIYLCGIIISSVCLIIFFIVDINQDSVRWGRVLQYALLFDLLKNACPFFIDLILTSYDTLTLKIIFIWNEFLSKP